MQQQDLTSPLIRGHQRALLQGDPDEVIEAKDIASSNDGVHVSILTSCCRFHSLVAHLEDHGVKKIGSFQSKVHDTLGTLLPPSRPVDYEAP